MYLAIKAHVIAIESAIEQKEAGDFYISDLWQIFEAILKHSRYDTTVWENLMVNFEHPTPYAFLMKTITNDFKDLSAKCISGIVFNHAVTLNNMILSLAMCWSCCIWAIARSNNEVNDRFRNKIIEDYLNFILQIGYAPQDIFGNNINGVSFDEWRDIFVSQLQDRFKGEDRITTLKRVFDKLDLGKLYVQNGKNWLVTKFN